MRDAGITREAMRQEPDYPIRSLCGLWIFGGVLVAVAVAIYWLTGSAL
jgi:hypothetical protein